MTEGDSVAFPGHKCQLNNLRSVTSLPHLLPTASWAEKFVYFVRKSIIVSRSNPVTGRAFKSQASIARENRRLSKLPYLIIHPCSAFSAVWQLIVLISYALYLTTVPYFIVFYHHSFEGRVIGTQIIQITVCLILYLEIAIKWHTSYYDEKNELFILSRSKIRSRYLSATFFTDIIAAFPSVILMTFSPRSSSTDPNLPTYLVILYFGVFLLNFLNISKIIRYFHTVSVYCNFSSRTDLMIKLVCGSLYIVHMVSLASILVSEFIVHRTVMNDENAESMLEWDKLESYLKYSRTCLFTLEGFLGCGYANLDEWSIYQKYMNTFILICGWICQAVTLTTLLKAAKSRSRSSAKYDEFMRDVNDYCRKFNLSNNLSANIYSYIEHKFRNNYFNETHLHQTLSTRLTTEITMDQCSRLLDKVDIFKNLPSSTMKQIMRCLKLEMYLPGELLIKANTESDKIFFLASGSVVVTTESGREINFFEDGSYFGETTMLIKQQNRTASIIATELCETYILSREDFFSVIEPNSPLLKQMQDIAFQRLKEDPISNAHVAYEN